MSDLSSICPNSPGAYKGIYRDLEKRKIVGVSGLLRCNSWKCPYCRPLKLKKLRARIFNGQISQEPSCKGYRTKYYQKMMTFTCAGAHYRSKHTPEEALEEMTKDFHKLVDAMRKKIGDFLYFRVVEPQQDGFPHFHVVFVGKGIAPKSILFYLENLWTVKYGWGNVDVKWLSKSVKHSIRYVTKYLLKGADNIKKYARIFSSCRKALLPIKKREYIMSRIYFGRTDMPQGVVEVEIEDHIPDKARDWLSDQMKYKLLTDERKCSLKLSKSIILRKGGSECA